jgi:hypothetical protein
MPVELEVICKDNLMLSALLYLQNWTIKHVGKETPCAIMSMFKLIK